MCSMAQKHAPEVPRIPLPRTPVNGPASDFYVLFREKTASDGTDWGSYAVDHPLGCRCEGLEGRRVLCVDPYGKEVRLSPILDVREVQPNHIRASDPKVVIRVRPGE